MFKPLAMQRMSLKTMREDAPLAMLVLADAGVFAPEAAELPDEVLTRRPSESYGKVFNSAKSRLDKIGQHITLPPQNAKIELTPISFEELETINQKLGTFWAQLSDYEEQIHQLQDEKHRINSLKKSLEVFKTLDFDLSLLKNQQTFLNLHMGSLAIKDLERLEQSIALETHYFTHIFYKTLEIAYVLIIGSGASTSAENIQKLLKASSFQPLTIPQEFADKPEHIQQNLNQQLKQVAYKIQTKQEDLEKLQTTWSEEFSNIVQQLQRAAPYAIVSHVMRGGHSGLTLIEGWIPKREIERLNANLQKKLKHAFVLNLSDPHEEEAAKVPTLLEHPKFFQSFENLVRNFGIPSYNEIDPTILFASSFILMFGMMFGDIGHGALIALIGWYFRDKLKSYTTLMVSAGISSFLFGFLYGSIFGYEHVIHAIWIPPLTDPMLMLTVALFWGISFILIAASLKFYNLLKAKDYHAAWLDNRGMAGIVFYLGLLYSMGQMMSGKGMTTLAWFFMLAPFAVIMGFKWYEQRKLGFAERMIIVIVEGFETIMNFISNTLSFMRVAAFSLNHAALALAVFAIANSMDTFGHWTTVVLGNLFILIVEGAIVAIQVLRLEYYEGFARFFSGTGKAFKPLKL